MKNRRIYFLILALLIGVCLDSAHSRIKVVPSSGDPEKVLMDALYYGDAETVKRVLDGGFDPGKLDCAKYVLRGQREPNSNPQRCLAVLKTLVDHGFSISQSWKGIDGPILFEVNDPDLIDFFVGQGVDVDELDRDRNTPLHYWAGRGDVKAVGALLKNKAFPNAVNSEGHTPLCEALKGPIIQYGCMLVRGPFVVQRKKLLPFPSYLDTLRLLVDAGADPDRVNKDCVSSESGAEHADYREKASEIMAKSQKSLVRRRVLPSRRSYVLIPDQDILYLFSLLDTRYRNKWEAWTFKTSDDLSEVGDLPVLKVARAIYKANPGSASNFAKFLDNLIIRSPSNKNINYTTEVLNQNRGFNLLHAAAYRGDADLVAELLKNGVDPNITDFKGNNALHYLTKGSGNRIEDVLRIANLLLDQGTNVNALNQMGETPLMVAWFYECPGEVMSHYTLVSYLMKRGADPLLGKSPEYNFADSVHRHFSYAQKYGLLMNQNLYRKLLENLKSQGLEPLGDNNLSKQRDYEAKDPLLKAIREEDIDEAIKIIASNRDVSKPMGGVYPIQAAMCLGDKGLPLVKMMVQKGARLDEPTGSESLFEKATSQSWKNPPSSQVQLIGYLLSQGLKPNADDLFNRTMQERGLGPSGQKILTMLLESGLDPNICNGWSPLQIAMSKGNLEAVEILVQFGAHPDACFPPGYSNVVPNMEIKEALGHVASRMGKSILPRLVQMTESTPRCTHKASEVVRFPIQGGEADSPPAVSSFKIFWIVLIGLVVGSWFYAGRRGEG